MILRVRMNPIHVPSPIDIREVSTAELPTVVDIQRAGFYQDEPDRDVHQLEADLSAGSTLLGAYNGSELIGYVQHFPRDGWLWSQTAVFLPEFQGRGFGYTLKMAQRQWALMRGYRIIRWRYNPRRTRNAMLNLAKLGGQVFEVEPHEHPGRGVFNYFHVTWGLDAQPKADFPGHAVNAFSTGRFCAAEFFRLPVPLIDRVSDQPDWNPVIRRVSDVLVATGDYAVVSFRLSPDDRRFGEYLFARR